MSWLQRFISPGGNRHARHAAKKLHDQVMSAARSPVLYEKGWLPDTMDGRFHAVCLHSALIIPRLERAGNTGPKVSAELNVMLFDSFDAALRETGVGDASIARRIRKMGETFVGLGRALSAGLQADEPPAELTGILVRNRISEPDVAPDLAAYILDRDEALTQAPTEYLLNGNLPW